MCWPCGSGHQVSVNHSLIHGHLNISSTRCGNVGRYRRITAAAASFESTSRRQQLRGVTDGGNGLARFREVPHQFEHHGVEPQIFWSTPTGKDERVITLGRHFVEGCVQSEVVSTLLAVGLITFEVVN